MTEQPQTTDAPARAAEERAPETQPAPGPLTVPGPLTAPAPDVPPAPAPRKDRRVLRAALRWTAVVTVFAALGAGSAYGITRADRTDLPGLATESDGRWAYPRIERPPLPPGRPRPFDGDNLVNAHYADLRALLLPAPDGARDDKALHGADGWLPAKDLLSQYAAEADQEELGQLLTDYGLRHVAARGWTTGDGTRTRIYLMQFGTAEVVDELFGTLVTYDSPAYALSGAAETTNDEAYPASAVPVQVTRYAYDEAEPYGPEQVRQAYVQAGDVVALVVQSRKGTAAAVPFQQTVTLQSELLA
ncbi:hypothetical protein [Streptomyces galbus]|uniref:Uncharacterized protein n=1 Tax=Streptomyces galbus TaxID=33898 RepID=A0A4U5WY46_STRGB|nr:hypothetical protein [Streptomyces galbus]TKT06852.1 hypothetical protein E4U92_23480 [Streptomyces galbus]GHD35743.1 hypothetical protein GCM10010335_31320 [Streptomyces galbus]